MEESIVRGMGQFLVTLGVLFVLVGLLAWSGALAWFGRLPGDIRISGERVHVFIPITSMIIVSAVVTLLMSLFRR